MTTYRANSHDRHMPSLDHAKGIGLVLHGTDARHVTAKRAPGLGGRERTAFERDYVRADIDQYDIAKLQLAPTPSDEADTRDATDMVFEEIKCILDPKKLANHIFLLKYNDPV